MSNIQRTIEKQRAEYAKLGKPLLQYMAEVHQLTVRQFAEIFEISKSHASKVLSHEVFPSVELAVRIARYFETNVDELFGWRVDDEGSRRSLLVEIPGEGVLKLNMRNSGRGSDFSGLKLVERVLKGGENGNAN